jgi:hypothetical protein
MGAEEGERRVSEHDVRLSFRNHDPPFWFDRVQIKCAAHIMLELDCVGAKQVSPNQPVIVVRFS